jgi:hypothetical protein
MLFNIMPSSLFANKMSVVFLAVSLRVPNGRTSHPP